MEKNKKEGWTWLINSKKWHYFRNGISLCGKFMNLGNPNLEQGNNESSDNCAACKKMILKEIKMDNKVVMKITKNQAKILQVSLSNFNGKDAISLVSQGYENFEDIVKDQRDLLNTVTEIVNKKENNI
jgi:precorrin-2 methylase